MKELDLIRWIRERAVSGPGVLTGVGDDAAVLARPGGPVVVTTDMLVEGTHFSVDDPPTAVGFKALAVSVSDIAAMGCRAGFAFLSVALRRDLPDGYDAALLEGVVRLAREFDISLAGGDTTETEGPIAICSTVLGEPPPGGRPILRSGARPGEALLVTGRLGGSLAGRHLRFRPRQREALELVGRADVGAMIDISDGLSTDARHLAEESEVAIRIEGRRVPASDAAKNADDGRSALDHALHDGEDFELLFTVPGSQRQALEANGLLGLPVTRIGEVLTGEPGVTLMEADGRERTLGSGGYEHFR